MSSKLTKGPDLAVGTRVLTGAGFSKKGEIRFIGTTKFATGEWIGVRLDTPDGKNDGSVGGTRYFEAEPNYGTFVKRAQVKPDTARTRAQTGASTPPAATGTASTATRTATGSSTARPAPASSPRTGSSPRVGATTASKTAAPGSPRVGESTATRKTVASTTSPIKGSTKTSSSSTGNLKSSSTAEAPRSIKGGGRGSTTEAKTTTPVSTPSGSRLMNHIRNMKVRSEGSMSSVDRIKEKISAAAPDVTASPGSPGTTGIGDFSSPIARAEAAMATAAATTASVAATSGVTPDPTASAPPQGFITPLATPITAIPQTTSDDIEGYLNTIKELQHEKENLMVKVRLLENKLADESSGQIAQDSESSLLELEEKVTILEADNQRLQEQHQSTLDALAFANAEAKKFAEEAAAAQAAAASATAAAAATPVTAPVSDADSQLIALQDQLEDLQLQVESLKLDKETIQLDMETLEEQYMEWKREVKEAVEEMDIMSSVTSAATDNVTSSPSKGMVATAEGMAEVSGSGEVDGDSAAIIFQLREENEKFREALRRLNHVSIQDKSALHTLHIKANALEEEALALRSYKQEAESNILELRQSVDAAHESGAMSEALALKNIHLQEELQQAQETIHELEEAQELNEEIDQQQRSQIESDAQIIEMLNGSIDAYEEVIEQKEQELGDYAHMVDKLKVANKTLKHEIHRLNVLRANASVESKQVEARLQELASLRARQEVIANDMSVLYEESMHITMEKYKFQAMHSRYESIFGSTLVYKEESNLLSSEITYLTCLSSGFEATRCVSAALDLALDQESRAWVGLYVAHTSDSSSETYVQAPVVAAALGRLYLLLLHSISATLEANLHLYVDNDTADTADSGGAMGHQAQAAQMMMKIKALYEKIVHVGGQAQQLCTDLMKDAQLKNEEEEDMGLEVLEEEHEAGVDVVDGEDEVNEIGLKPVVASPGVHTDAAGNKIGTYILEGKSTASVNELLVRVNECSTDLAVIFQSSIDGKRTTETKETDSVALLGGMELMRPPVPIPEEDSDGRFPILQVETHFLALNTLCNIALHQAEAMNASSDQNSEERLVDGSTDSLNYICAILKSMKVDLKTGLYNLKSNQGHYKMQRGELSNIFSTLVSICFEQKEEKIHLNSSTASTDSADALSSNTIGDAINTLHFKASDPNTLQTMKTLSERVRKVNNSPGVLNHNNSSTIVALGMTVVMRYYPMLFMTTVGTIADPHQMSGLREQFRQLLEKYWSLTSKGTNDLLAATFTASSASSIMRSSTASFDDSDQSTTSGSSSIDLAWKVRTLRYRDVVNEKLGEQAFGSGILAGRAGVASAVAEVTMQLQNVTKELDEKRDELRTAMNRCRDLQSQVDTLVGRGGAKRKGSIVDSVAFQSGTEISSEVLADLRNEIATLEAALETTEKRAEELEIENKHLKHHGGHDAADAPAPPNASFSGSITSSPAIGNMSSKNLRRQSLMNIAEAISGATIAAGGNEAIVSPPPLSLSSSKARSGSSSNIFMQLLDDTSNAPASPMKSSSPMPLQRRMSSFNMSNAAAVAIAQAAEASTAAAVAAAATPTAADEQHVQMLIGELMHWKSMALKRLTASLLPLDIPPQLRKIYEELGSSALMSGQEVDMEVGAMYANAEVKNFTSISKASEALVLSEFVDEAVPLSDQVQSTEVGAVAESKTSNVKGIRVGEFKHIEFLTTPVDVNTEAYDVNGEALTVKASTYAALYHRLRLARAANIRIKALDAAEQVAAVEDDDADAKSSGFKRAQEMRRKLRARSNLIYRIPTV